MSSSRCAATAAATAAAASAATVDPCPAEHCPNDRMRHRPDPPVNTSTLYRTVRLPDRFERPYVFTGYGCQLRDGDNPLYRTTSSAYGWHTPNAHTVPQQYHPRSNEFSELHGRCGMYRNYSLNMAMDASAY